VAIQQRQRANEENFLVVRFRWTKRTSSGCCAHSDSRPRAGSLRNSMGNSVSPSVYPRRITTHRILDDLYNWYSCRYDAITRKNRLPIAIVDIDGCIHTELFKNSTSVSCTTPSEFSRSFVPRNLLIYIRSKHNFPTPFLGRGTLPNREFPHTHTAKGNQRRICVSANMSRSI